MNQIVAYNFQNLYKKKYINVNVSMRVGQNNLSARRATNQIWKILPSLWRCIMTTANDQSAQHFQSIIINIIMSFAFEITNTH